MQQLTLRRSLRHALETLCMHHGIISSIIAGAFVQQDARPPFSSHVDLFDVR
jgi:hypothetical protein